MYSLTVNMMRMLFVTFFNGDISYYDKHQNKKRTLRVFR
jgi:hypothetical protein